MKLAHLAGAVVLVLAPAAVTAADAVLHHKQPIPQCVKPTRLKHPESLNEWYRQTGITPAIELKVAARCWHPYGGWTPDLANLLDGKYGPDYRTARLPARARLWDQL